VQPRCREAIQYGGGRRLALSARSQSEARNAIILWWPTASPLTRDWAVA
jgi:hypothetical protein